MLFILFLLYLGPPDTKQLLFYLFHCAVIAYSTFFGNCDWLEEKAI